MSLSLHTYRKRTVSFDITAKDANGDAVVFASGDVFRAKVGRAGEVPVLDLDSAADSANGSSMTAANPTRIIFDQDDMDVTPGAYDLEVAIVDASDSNRIKHVESGVINVLDTQEGDIAAT